MTEHYTIKELADSKGTSAPVRFALLEMETRLMQSADAIEAQAAEIARLREELLQLEVDAMEHYNDWMEHGCEPVEAARFAFDLGQYTRAALAGDSQ